MIEWFGCCRMNICFNKKKHVCDTNLKNMSPARISDLSWLERNIVTGGTKPAYSCPECAGKSNRLKKGRYSRPLLQSGFMSFDRQKFDQQIWPTNIWPTNIWLTNIWLMNIWMADIWPTDIWKTHYLLEKAIISSYNQKSSSSNVRRMFWG